MASAPTQMSAFPSTADYYIARPAPPASMPSTCADNTGILYKSTVIQGTGANAGKLATGMPLLDCVADMQVVYGLDTDGAGRINQYLNAPANTSSPTAEDIRTQLREIRSMSWHRKERRTASTLIQAIQFKWARSLMGYRGVDLFLSRPNTKITGGRYIQSWCGRKICFNKWR
ncbi:PilW family protein [Geotalea toluenoxydans]|uniref:PilW family protein n=1 Tax=Geotalea toluenoxydans TaxID=421624 RepID=UPI000A82A7AB